MPPTPMCLQITEGTPASLTSTDSRPQPQAQTLSVRRGTTLPTSGSRCSLTSFHPASVSPDCPPGAVAQTPQLPSLPLLLPPQALGWRNMALRVLRMDVYAWGFCSLLPAPGVLGSLFFSPGITWELVAGQTSTPAVPGLGLPQHHALARLHMRPSREAVPHIIFVGQYYSLSPFLPTSHVTPPHPPIPQYLCPELQLLLSWKDFSWKQHRGSLGAEGAWAYRSLPGPAEPAWVWAGPALCSSSAPGSRKPTEK